MTYDELYVLIQTMTPEQRNKPVKTYSGFDGELHPEIQSAHPGYDFEIKLIPMTDIPGYEDSGDPEQLVIYPELSREGTLACELLHLKKIVDDPDASPEINRWRRERLEAIEEVLYNNGPEYLLDQTNTD